jgi:hypothetical protein
LPPDERALLYAFGQPIESLRNREHLLACLSFMHVHDLCFSLCALIPPIETACRDGAEPARRGS